MPNSATSILTLLKRLSDKLEIIKATKSAVSCLGIEVSCASQLSEMDVNCEIYNHIYCAI